MIIHSSEYFNAIKDYNITISQGYFFNKEDIFSKFVDDLYNLRLKYPKGDPMNYTCKLIMNYLYGRFGMKPITSQQEFVDKEKFLELSQEHTINDFIDLDESGLFVSYEDPKLIRRSANVNVAVASAVTAYARIYMSKFKNQKYPLYYSDTDSIYIDEKLPEELVGDKIGQFKLENIFKDIVFLGPKIYAGITSNEEYICKVKGYKNPNLIPYKEFKNLLKHNKSLELHHDKWFRSLSKSEILIKDQVYNLVSTENKREFIKEDNGLIIDTSAFKFD